MSFLEKMTTAKRRSDQSLAFRNYFFQNSTPLISFYQGSTPTTKSSIKTPNNHKPYRYIQRVGTNPKPPRAKPIHQSHSQICVKYSTSRRRACRGVPWRAVACRVARSCKGQGYSPMGLGLGLVGCTFRSRRVKG